MKRTLTALLLLLALGLSSCATTVRSVANPCVLRYDGTEMSVPSLCKTTTIVNLEIGNSPVVRMLDEVETEVSAPLAHLFIFNSMVVAAKSLGTTTVLRFVSVHQRTFIRVQTLT